MNDAYRGALIVAAAAALVMGLTLAVASLVQWKRAARRHIGHHVVLMTVGLCVTAGLVIAGAVADAGENLPLEWWDIARGVQIVLITAGLRPLWVHQARQKQAATRREAR